MRLLWFFAGLVFASSFGICAQTAVGGRSDGRITGTVTGQDGQPVAEAYVMAVESLNQSLNNPPSTRTDLHGQFEISGLPLRNYHVYASKPQDGYPMADPAYSEENQAAIALSPDRPADSVVISIRKAGIVTLDVTDKTTGKPVSGSYKLSVPRRWETQGEISYPLLIHPSTDVMLEVSAKGYKTWFYSDASNPSHPLPLRLASGEQKSLKIELEPEARKGTSTNP
jgi:hypothetical protein